MPPIGSAGLLVGFFSLSELAHAVIASYLVEEDIAPLIAVSRWGRDTYSTRMLRRAVAGAPFATGIRTTLACALHARRRVGSLLQREDRLTHLHTVDGLAFAGLIMSLRPSYWVESDVLSGDKGLSKALCRHIHTLVMSCLRVELLPSPASHSGTFSLNDMKAILMGRVLASLPSLRTLRLHGLEHDQQESVEMLLAGLSEDLDDNGHVYHGTTREDNVRVTELSLRWSISKGGVLWAPGNNNGNSDPGIDVRRLFSSVQPPGPKSVLRLETLRLHHPGVILGGLDSFLAGPLAQHLVELELCAQDLHTHALDNLRYFLRRMVTPEVCNLRRIKILQPREDESVPQMRRAVPTVGFSFVEDLLRSPLSPHLHTLVLDSHNFAHRSFHSLAYHLWHHGLPCLHTLRLSVRGLDVDEENDAEEGESALELLGQGLGRGNVRVLEVFELLGHGADAEGQGVCRVVQALCTADSVPSLRTLRLGDGLTVNEAALQQLILAMQEAREPMTTLVGLDTRHSFGMGAMALAELAKCMCTGSTYHTATGPRQATVRVCVTSAAQRLTTLASESSGSSDAAQKARSYAVTILGTFDSVCPQLQVINHVEVPPRGYACRHWRCLCHGVVQARQQQQERQHQKVVGSDEGAEVVLREEVCLTDNNHHDQQQQQQQHDAEASAAADAEAPAHAAVYHDAEEVMEHEEGGEEGEGIEE